MEPPPGLRAALRQEVGRLRARERRRVFAARVCVGTPAGELVGHEIAARDTAEMDAGLRTDVVARLLEQVPRADTMLLLRPGGPYHHDLDLAWYAAARLAFDSAGRGLAGFYAITRTGWLDVVTGERREWKRLRL